MREQSQGAHDEALVVAYRHDAHKLYGQSHADAVDRRAGVDVNQPVSDGADGDAAALSRPRGEPRQTVDNHTTPYRLSLVDGESRSDQRITQGGVESGVRALLVEPTPEALHRAWLASDVAALFNEAVSYPYTSLKYHTLLVAALLDNYRAGHAFADLQLVVDDADRVVPHRTVYANDAFTFRLTAAVDGQPSARLGDRPRRSWAATWTQLTAHPLDTDHDTSDMVLDANLRRIRSWSTALQYIDDYREAFGG